MPAACISILTKKHSKFDFYVGQYIVISDSHSDIYVYSDASIDVYILLVSMSA